MLPEQDALPTPDNGPVDATAANDRRNADVAPTPGPADMAGAPADVAPDLPPVVDTDADGVPDLVDLCPAAADPLQRDADGDGLGDACDVGDADGDGVADREDLCPSVAAPTGDSDGDGLGDRCDTCRDQPDPRQSDGDADGIGDACEIPGDDDADGVPDGRDLCPQAPDPTQDDTDRDGLGNACDACPLLSDPDGANTDADPYGDACDVCPLVPESGSDHLDVDGDGVPACAGDCDDADPRRAPGLAERCDALDNDCDGTADEDFGDVGGPCVAGFGACTAVGHLRCQDALHAACDASPGAPGVEICNGADDDCDGATDEDLGERICGVGGCAHPVPACVGGPDPCDPLLGAAPEVCNGVDDDCDGTTDEDIPPVPCGCVPDAPGCVDGAPGQCLGPDTVTVPEVCNGEDDDCNGVVDDVRGTPTLDRVIAEGTDRLYALIAYNAGRVLVYLNDGPDSPDRYRTAVFAPDGSVLVPWTSRPDLRARRFFAAGVDGFAYYQKLGVAPDELSLGIGDADGNFGPPVRVMRAEDRWLYEAMVARGGDGFGATWHDGQTDLLFAPLDAAGAPTGPTVRLTETPLQSHAPVLLWTGTEYGFSWRDFGMIDGVFQSRTYFRRLDATGAPLSEPTAVRGPDGNAGNPLLAWTGTEYVGTWHEDGPDQALTEAVYLQRFSAEGVLVGDPIVLSSPAAPGRSFSGVAWTGQHLAVWWADVTRQPTFAATRYVRWLSPTGDFLGPIERTPIEPFVYGPMVWAGDRLVTVTIRARPEGGREAHLTVGEASCP